MEALELITLVDLLAVLGHAQIPNFDLAQLVLFGGLVLILGEPGDDLLLGRP